MELLVLLFVIFVWGLFLYNRLVRARNACDEAWAGIDTELKRRYDLIPALVETVKGYAAYERETLNRVIEARSRAVASTGSPASQARDENILVGALRELLAIAENYPHLKADEHFLQLQKELINTEDRIQAARRFYNANVRDLNNLIESVPTNVLAQWFGFEKREFFEIESAIERTTPEVKL